MQNAKLGRRSTHMHTHTCTHARTHARTHPATAVADSSTSLSLPLLRRHRRKFLVGRAELLALLLLARVLLDLDLLELLQVLGVLRDAVLDLSKAGVHVLVRVDALVLPTALLEPHRSVTDVAAVHVAQRGDHVLRSAEGHEAVALGLACSLIADDLGLLEGAVLPESVRQQIVGDLVTQVSAEEPVIVLRPIVQGGVSPNLAGGLPKQRRCCFRRPG
mmetsp:Transcript_91221/g.261065  ORF Transcript_91221/g.261065 Transcript_91221/m.261065 type:complete len:218 (+) Transcript_91221:113-766(+)